MRIIRTVIGIIGFCGFLLAWGAIGGWDVGEPFEKNLPFVLAGGTMLTSSTLVLLMLHE